MSDRARLRDEIARVIDGDAEGIAYHGPSTKSNLIGITAELASARPVAASHSIWELAAHMKVDREWAIARLKGEKPDMDWWPALPSPSAGAWSALLRDMDDVQARLQAAVMTASNDDDVHAVARFLMHHEVYHSGQIALLRRALGLAGRPG